MPSKSKAQQRFFGMVRRAQKDSSYRASPAVYRAAKSMKKEDVKDFAKTKTDKLPEKVEGGADESRRRCKYCKKGLRKYGPERGKGYIFNPDREDSYIGAYSCTNRECPHQKEKGYPWSVPILPEHIVSHDTEIILDGEKYLLEAGDRIIIEND